MPSGAGGWTGSPESITIPANAGPADPRIVITAAPPASIGYPIDAALLFYWNETDYWYFGVSAFGPNFSTLVTGFVAVTTGDSDHIEEWGWSGGSRETSYERFVNDYSGVAGSASLFVDPASQRHRVSDGAIIRDAESYWINGLSSGAGNADDEPQQTQDVNLTTVAVVMAAGVAGTETVVHVIDGDNPFNSTSTFQSNRRYELRYTGRIQSTIANDRVQLRIRENGVAGTVERDCGQVQCIVAGVPYVVDVGCLIEGDQSSPALRQLTAQRVAGTGAITYTPDSAWARDVVSDVMT